MRLLIADDNAVSRKLLLNMIQRVQNYEVVGEAVNGEDLIQKAQVENPDIVLVDINMPLLNGVEAIKSCKKILPSLQVIFTTSYDDYALEAFDVHAIDYIVKPIKRDRLYDALERAAVFKTQDSAKRTSSTNKDLMVKLHNQYTFIPLDDIIYIEKVQRKAVIHTVNEKIEFNEALYNLEERLDSRFVVSHRSYIINLHYLARIEVAGQTYIAHFKNYHETARVSKYKLDELQKHKSL